MSWWMENGLSREGTEYRYDLTFEGKQQYFKRINTGNKVSNYFQQVNRWSVDGSVSPVLRELGSLKNS